MRENKIISTNYIAPKIKQIVVHAEIYHPAHQ